MAGIIIKPRSRILHGHDWVFGSEILKAFGSPADGDVVSIKDGRDRLLGSGIYNSRSHITVRRFSRRRQELDRDFFQRRLTRAWELRRRLGLDSRPCRVVWSESDGLPGVIVDRYGPCAVLQTQTLAMDQHKQVLAELAREILGVETVIERNDSASRVSEGMEPSTGILCGTAPELFSFEISGVTFQADLLSGQKTGFYLDQLPSYETISAFAANRRVLDCFSNQGGFALTAAKAGATTVTAVESGENAVEALRRNALENSLQIQVERADVFEFLRRSEKQKAEFDLIILDPPSFAKGRGSTDAALKGYRELHLRAAALLSHNGILASFSCSHHITPELFLEAAKDAFLGAHRNFRLVDRIHQPPDHPILLHLPETEYLKGFVFEAMAPF